MTMDEWVKKYMGKKIDYDGVYGVQCVDLAKHFIKHVLGVEPQSIGNAIEYYRKRKTSKYLTDNFKWIDKKDGFIPQKGDLCVFNSKSGNGHISIATGEGTKSHFYSYDENYPSSSHEPMTTARHSYERLYGVLRPKNQENINSAKDKDDKPKAPSFKVGSVYTLTTNVKVRTGAGTDHAQKKVSQLTADGKKNCTSQKSSDSAVLKNKTRVTVKEVKKDGKDIWLKIPSGWICAYYKGDQYVK